MYARIRSTVLSVGERPRASPRIRCGSPTALRPNVVGLMPLLSRNASTRDLNCCSHVSMPVTVKAEKQVRQPMENLPSACSGYR